MTIKFHKKLVRTPGFPWFLREISAFTQQNSDLIGVLLSYSSSASVVVSTLDSWSEIPGSNPTFAKLCSLFKYLSMKFKKWKGGRGMGSSPTAAKWYAKAQIGPLCNDSVGWESTVHIDKQKGSLIIVDNIKQVIGLFKSRTTDARWGNHLHCTAENQIPIPNL